MKTKLLLTTVACSLFLSLAAYAQVPPGISPAQMRQSPMIQQSMKNGVKTSVRSFWDGKGSSLMFFGLLSDTDTRAALGVSDEMYLKIQGAANPNPLNNPEMMKIMMEMGKIVDRDDPLMMKASQEKIDQFLEVQGRMQSLSFDAISNAMDKVLSPEQKQTLLEAQLAIMGETPIVSPNIFEALDLTDAQKEEMEAIKKELEPEFEMHLETFANSSVAIANKVFEQLEKEGGFGDTAFNQQAIQERMLETTKKLQQDPEFKKIQEDIGIAGKAFTAQFQTKMFDVLTDAQWTRLQTLTDDPPKFAKVLLKKMKEPKEEPTSQGGWQPGPNSWKPGDPVPEEYRQERNWRRGFPRSDDKAKGSEKP